MIFPGLVWRLLCGGTDRCLHFDARCSSGAPLDAPGRLDRRVVVSRRHGGVIGAARNAVRRPCHRRFRDRGERHQLGTCNGVPKRSALSSHVEFARHTRVDLVIFSLPISARIP